MLCLYVCCFFHSMYNVMLPGPLCSFNISAFAPRDVMFDVCSSALFYMRHLGLLKPQNDSLIDRLGLEDKLRHAAYTTVRRSSSQWISEDS